MKAPARLAAPAAAVCAALAVTAGPTSAATTTIRQDTAAGAPYSGNWQVSTVGPLAFSSTFLGANVTGTCDSAQLQGDATSAGAGEVTAASVGACRMSNGFTSPPTDLDLSGVSDRSGQITYSPVQGGRDGVIAINPGLRITLTGQILGITVTCIYGSRTGSGNGLTFDVYNRDNPNRPLPDDDLQAKATTISFVRQPGSSLLCPGSATGSGTAIGRGESTPGSGVFDRKLYLTS
ncbi:hypothetical protein ACRYCC_34755 [Actinomadura scrupuli]|uniref:hypothetical protein n=1 Tax=Actinomadura scrupuli TaxID=559629 RepID=UPI003D97C943